MKKIILLLFVLLLLSGCSEKMYNSNDILKELNKQYNDEFVIISQDTSRDTDIYEVIIKGKKDQVFPVKHSYVSSNEFGPFYNSVTSTELDDYYMNSYTISKSEAFTKISEYLDKNYNYKDVSYDRITPKFYCENGEHICGYTYYEHNYSNDTSCYVLYDGNTINDDCKNFFK